jgi:hypothetical protein
VSYISDNSIFEWGYEQTRYKDYKDIVITVPSMIACGAAFITFGAGISVIISKNNPIKWKWHEYLPLVVMVLYTAIIFLSGLFPDLHEVWVAIACTVTISLLGMKRYVRNKYFLR